MHFSGLRMLTRRLTVCTIEKGNGKQRPPWSIQEASVIVFRLVAWFIVIENSTDLRVINLTYINTNSTKQKYIQLVRTRTKHKHVATKFLRLQMICQLLIII